MTRSMGIEGEMRGEEEEEEEDVTRVWQELGAQPLPVNATENELQNVRNKVRQELALTDQTLFPLLSKLFLQEGKTKELELGIANQSLDLSHLESIPGTKLKALLREYRSTVQDITAAQKVADWWSNHEEFSRHRQRFEFSKAVEVLEKLKVAEEDRLDSVQGGEGGCDELEKQYSSLLSSLTEEVAAKVKSLVESNLTESGGRATVVTKWSANELWTACYGLGIQAHLLEELKMQLQESILMPILRDVKGLELVSNVDGGFEWTMAAKAADPGVYVSGLRNYATLVMVLWRTAYGRNQCCRDSAVDALWHPALHAMRSIWSEVITKENLHSSSEYPKLIAELISIENGLRNDKLLGDKDRLVSEDLQEYVESLSEEMLVQYRSYLARARDLIVNDYGKGMDSAILIHPEESGLPLRAQSRPYMISSVSANIVTVQNQIMEEAGKCSNIVLARKLIEMISDVAMLWIHLPGKLYKQELKSVAHLVMLYFNDTVYIATFMTHLTCKWHNLFRDCDMLPELSSKVNQLNQVAFSHAHAQVSERTLQLQSLISANKFFRSTHKPSQGKKVRRAIVEIRVQIERLANIWKSILAPEYFSRFLGAILDHLCTNIYAEIMSANDISIDETETLPMILLELLGNGLRPFLLRRSPGQTGQTGQTEADNAPSPSSGDYATYEGLFRKYAPSWTKLGELVNLFSMSLQDIVNKWEAKELEAKGYTRDEIVHFISLVFEDGEYRREKVNHIVYTN